MVREKVCEPSAHEFLLIVAGLEQAYSLPTLERDWFTYDKLRQMLQDLDFTSTPGIPYMREAPTIGQWLGWDGIGNFDESQVLRLWHDVQLCHAGKWRHLYRAFIKEEPHKQSKIQAKRWRLILCAALPMQMLWRMAVKHQNQWLNDHPYECPSAHGLVFCYGGWRRFQAHCRAHRIKYSRDISSWDVNAPGWVFRALREWRKRAGGPDDWLRVMDLLYDDAFVSSEIRFSNGIVVRQMYEGTMKSGLYITISDNSAGQVAIDIGACLRSGQKRGAMKATGDDVIQEFISDSYLDELEKLGCVVKEYEASLIFMGTDFNEES
uniref:RNA-dependent RNA polymerase n=1 Tax=Sotepeofons virus TaxID=3072221 RepID=A0AA96NKY7_9VIRU|nr:MAG: RNA-dependent RNA polymerase [Sotepeofons virus]